MRRYILAVLLIFVAGSAFATTPDSLSPIQKLREVYKVTYPFFEMADTLYLPQTELQLIEGYHWPDSSRLTPIQNWMNHFPIWHQYKNVGIWNGEIAKKFDQITRCIHLPWNGPAYKDIAFPWRIAMEYLRYRQAESLFTFIPNAGATVSYSEFLNHKVAYGPRYDLKLLPDSTRAASVEEFYKCFGVAITNMNYKTLIANCDSVAVGSIGPGDLFVATDSTGCKGVAYVVMFTIENKKKERLFAVATGGEVSSDFHIPLFNKDRNRPWLSPEQIRALTPEGSIQAGFYRFSFLNNLSVEKP
ncbi:MAG: DUF4846 domain-containing protein [Candidatus Zixiibacteriota bacterium]